MSSMHFRTRLGRRTTAAIAFVTVLLLGSAAWAYWSASGAGAGAAATGTLNPPTGVTASSAPGSGSASVSWTAPATGAGPTGYSVSRTRVSDGSTAFACGSSATTLVQSPCTDSSVPAGTYTYAATAVAGSWTATSTSSAPVSVTTTVGTTTSLSSSANPSVSGQVVTYTATVTAQSGSASPTGSVTFRDGASAITCSGGNQALDASGAATCQVSYVGVGSHSMTAVYEGASTFAGSTSSALAQQVARAATTTALGSSSNPSKTGQSVTYTATVSVAGPGGGAPTGTLAFLDGGTVMAGCSAQTLTSGQATCTTSYAASSSPRSVTATYNGDTDFLASTSSAITQTVDKAGTTTALVSGANPAVTGQSVTLTATVSVTAPGAGTPTGTVAFKDGANTISCSGGSQTLNASRVATCQTSFSTSTAHSLVAVYAGNGDFTTSTSSPLSQVVNKASTTTVVTSSKNPQRSGQPVTYTATVATVSPGSGTPTGTVVFKDAGNVVAGCAAQALAVGMATCSQTYATIGNHQITAEYSSDANYQPSTSSVLTQRVVSFAVTGIAFTGVKVNGTAVTPSCTGGGTASYTCTVTGGNNDSVTANVAFVNSASTATVYSVDSTSLGTVSTGKQAGTGSVPIAGNATTSAATVLAQKSGSNPASVTVTLSDGVNSFTAVLTIN